MKLKGLYKKSDSGIWYYQPAMVKGVRPRAISLETKDEEEAVEAYFRTAKEAQREFSAESVRMEAARFLQDRREGGQHTERTSGESELVLKQFTALTANPPIQEVRPSHVLSFQAQMQEAGLSPATIKAKMGRLSAFFTWAVREGLIDQHPCRTVQLPRNVPNRSERYCTQPERDRLMESLDGAEPYVQLVFWLGFFAGLRKLEITEAHRDWVDLGGGVLHVKRTPTFLPKGKRDRIIRMSPRLTEFLARYLRGETPAGDSPFLLCPEKRHGKVKRSRGLKQWRYRFDPQRSFNAHCAGAGLDWVTFHTMRHTFATLHAIAGTPLSIIAKELGDDQQVVFQNYVGYTRHGDHAGATD